jgi:hypothetical protein
MKMSKRISKSEMKSIVGGNEPNTQICGTRYNAGQCYCDYCFANGTPVECDVKCYYTNCVASGLIPALQ